MNITLGKEWKWAMMIFGTYGEVLLGAFHPDTTITVLRFNKLEIRSGPECWTINMTAVEFDRLRWDINNGGSPRIGQGIGRHHK